MRAHMAALLFAFATLGVVVTANTQWWPWQSEASEAAPLPTPVNVGNSTRNTTSASTSQQGKVPSNTATPKADEDIPVPTQHYLTPESVPSEGVPGVPDEVVEQVRRGEGTLQVRADGTYNFTKKTGGEATRQTACTEFERFDLIKAECPITDNLRNIYQKAIPLAFLLVFLVIVYAGYQYIISLGNPEKVKSSAELLVSVVTGLALLLLIPLIVQALGLDKNPAPYVPTAQSSAQGQGESQTK